MVKKTSGIHHITSIVGDVKENVEFYREILGLRLVKKTVNFDDPETYHLYFGDEEGNPGTIITFFPYERARKGKIGDGQVGITSYAIPRGALGFWQERLSSFDIDSKREERFGQEILSFEDVHGLKLELVERKEGKESSWAKSGIDSSKAIKAFSGAVLFSKNPQETGKTLENLMGFEKIGDQGDHVRFKSSADLGNIIDVRKSSAGLGINSIGTVHHIAWRAEERKDQEEWQSLIRDHGLQVTNILDRNYFESIYFRERGGILFEIATDGPGFAIDEGQDSLGEKLMLPPQYEEHRDKIEGSLTEIR